MLLTSPLSAVIEVLGFVRFAFYALNSRYGGCVVFRFNLYVF
jgi:hypothetical protein